MKSYSLRRPSSAQQGSKKSVAGLSEDVVVKLPCVSTEEDDEDYDYNANDYDEEDDDDTEEDVGVLGVDELLEPARKAVHPDRQAVPPPLPLLKFDTFSDRDWNKISTFDGSQIPSIHDSFSGDNAGESTLDKLYNPVVSKLLWKWFNCRSRREYWFKQRLLSDYQQQQSLLQGHGPTSAEIDCLNTLPDDYRLLEVPVYRHSWKSRPPLDADVTKSDSMIFDSNFESGNLQYATRVLNRDQFMGYKPYDIVGDFIAPVDVDQEYDLKLRNDLFTDGNIQWYYFSVNPIRFFEENGKTQLTVRFNLINMKKNDSLYNYGMKPVVAVEDQNQVQNQLNGSNLRSSTADSASPIPSQSEGSMLKWHHGGFDICYYKNYIRSHNPASDSKRKKSSKDGYGINGRKNQKGRFLHSLSFTYTFHSAATVYFAHSYPYTYTDLERYLAKLEADERIKSIMFRRMLSWTLAGNRCDVLTITTRQSQCAPTEQSASNINKNSSNNISNNTSSIGYSTPFSSFGSCDANSNSFSYSNSGSNNAGIGSEHVKYKERDSTKPVVVITARVHPGETMASYIIHGIIAYLTADTPEAQLLRDNCIFKIVPMLNPDGVIHGNYRCSLAGVDLNRRYNSPHTVLSPTITALRQMIVQTQMDRQVLLFIDLHGHSKKKNAFTYGCDLLQQSAKRVATSIEGMHVDDIMHKRVYSRVFPRLLCADAIACPSRATSRSSEGASTATSKASSIANRNYFQFSDCKFKIARSKLGTGRVVCWEELNIDASYTIEVSFCSNGDNNESRLLKTHLDRLVKHLSPSERYRVRRSMEVAVTANSSLPSSPRNLGFYSPICATNTSGNNSSGVGNSNNSSALSMQPFRSLASSPIAVGSPGIAFRSSKLRQELQLLPFPLPSDAVDANASAYAINVAAPSDLAERDSFNCGSNDTASVSREGDSDNETIAKEFFDTYESNRHYNKDDYNEMGAHVCRTIAKFLNLTNPYEKKMENMLRQAELAQSVPTPDDDSIEALNQTTLESLRVATSALTSKSLAAATVAAGMGEQLSDLLDSLGIVAEPSSSLPLSLTGAARNPWSASPSPSPATNQQQSQFTSPFQSAESSANSANGSTDGVEEQPLQQLPQLRQFPVLIWKDLFAPVKTAAVYSANTIEYGTRLQSMLCSSSQQAANAVVISERFQQEREIRAILLAEKAAMDAMQRGKGGSSGHGHSSGRGVGGSGCYDDNDNDNDSLDAARNPLSNTTEFDDNDSDGGSDSEPSVDNAIGSKLFANKKMCPDGRSLITLLRKVDGSAARYHRDRQSHKTRRKAKDNGEDMLKMTLKAKSEAAPLRKSSGSGDMMKTTAPLSRPTLSQSHSQKLSSQVQVPMPSVPANKYAYEFRERPLSEGGSRAKAQSSSKSKSNGATIEIESLSHLVDHKKSHNLEVYYRTLLSNGNSSSSNSSSGTSPPAPVAVGAVPILPIANADPVSSKNRMLSRPVSAQPAPKQRQIYVNSGSTSMSNLLYESDCDNISDYPPINGSNLVPPIRPLSSAPHGRVVISKSNHHNHNAWLGGSSANNNGNTSSSSSSNVPIASTQAPAQAPPTAAMASKWATAATGTASMGVVGGTAPIFTTNPSHYLVSLPMNDMSSSNINKQNQTNRSLRESAKTSAQNANYLPTPSQSAVYQNLRTTLNIKRISNEQNPIPYK